MDYEELEASHIRLERRLVALERLVFALIAKKKVKKSIRKKK